MCSRGLKLPLKKKNLKCNQIQYNSNTDPTYILPFKSEVKEI